MGILDYFEIIESLEGPLALEKDFISCPIDKSHHRFLRNAWFYKSVATLMVLEQYRIDSFCEHSNGFKREDRTFVKDAKDAIVVLQNMLMLIVLETANDID